MKLSEFDEVFALIQRYRALREMTVGVASVRLVDSTGTVTVDFDLPFHEAIGAREDELQRCQTVISNLGVEID